MRDVLDGVRQGVDREVREARAEPVRAVQEVLVPPVVPARVQAGQLVRQPPVRVQEPRLLALPLAGPGRVLRLRLRVQGVQECPAGATAPSRCWRRRDGPRSPRT